MPRLSKGERTRMQQVAAEEFFLRRGRPPSQFRPAPTSEAPEPTPVTAPSAPATTVVTDWRESKRVLQQLLDEGKIKQTRK